MSGDFQRWHLERDSNIIYCRRPSLNHDCIILRGSIFGNKNNLNSGFLSYISLNRKVHHSKAFSSIYKSILWIDIFLLERNYILEKPFFISDDSLDFNSL